MSEFTKPYYTKVFLVGIGFNSKFSIFDSYDKNRSLPVQLGGQKLEKNENNKKSSAQFDLKFNINPIHPYIEVALLLNGVKQSAAKLVFRINSYVNINKGEVSSILQQGSSSNSLNGFKVTLEFYISKLDVSYFNNVVGSKIHRFGYTSW